MLSKNDLRPDPNNHNWTIPRSYGVWVVPSNGKSKRFRFGNNPVRKWELEREFNECEQVGPLLESREAAKTKANSLNRH